MTSRPCRITRALAFLLWTAASPGFAEDSCQYGLQAAEKSYQIGAFEEMPAQLSSCLSGREASRTERVQAYALLAKAYLALDEPDRARDAVSALLRADPAYEPGPPPQLGQLVQQVRREEATLQVASVSKTNESLREAPATVVVVTGEEIERRGYVDLEEMLHDLPGFDISRGNGETYSDFYLRGFRSFNDRNLLLLDGVEQNDRERLSPLYFVGIGPRGERTIEASDLAVRIARELDRQALRSFQPGFSDRTENWSIHGKIRISNLTFGLQRWRLEEGTAPWLTELTRPGEGSTWAPEHTAVYLKWTGSVGRNLSLQAFTRYIQSSVDSADSRSTRFYNYASYLLRITHLLIPCTDANGHPTGELCPQQPWIEVTSFSQLSSQLKSEATLVYNPSEKLSVVGGIELRKSSIQEEPDKFISARSDSHPPEDRREPVEIQSGRNEHTDVGLYAQASYRLRNSLRAVLAGRVDYNEINNRRPAASGFGALVTPRAALIYTPAGKPFVVKAIYSEAFKDPTDFEEFGTIPLNRDRPSDGLRPERVRNFELSGNWQPGEHLMVEVAAYQADYRDVVGLRQVPPPECILSPQTGGCGQLRNVGELRIRGVQVNARYAAGGLSFFGNYTYTEPFDTRPDPDPISPATGGFFYPAPLDTGEIRIGDIASHRVNAGLELEPLPRLIANFRMSYVGTRKTGSGTTVFANPYEEIDDYLLPKIALTWRDLIPGTDLQIVVNNPFDAKYYHPGVQTAGFGFAPRLPQPGRTVFLRLLSGSHEGD